MVEEEAINAKIRYNKLFKYHNELCQTRAANEKLSNREKWEKARKEIRGWSK